MKVLDSLKNVIPLQGCNIFQLENTLTSEDYVCPELIKIIKIAKEVPIHSSGYLKKRLYQDLLACSLVLMNTHGVFVDFKKEMVLVETSDSREYSVYYFKPEELELNFRYLFINLPFSFSLAYAEFLKEVRHRLSSETEDCIQLWNELVTLSVIHFDNQ